MTEVRDYVANTDNFMQRVTHILTILGRKHDQLNFFTVNTYLVILRPFYTECP